MKLLKLWVFIGCLVCITTSQSQRATIEESQENEDFYKQFPDIFFQRTQTQITTVSEVTTTKVTTRTTTNSPIEKDSNNKDVEVDETIPHETQFDTDYELFWDEYDIEGRKDEKPKKLIYTKKNSQRKPKLHQIDISPEDLDWFKSETDLSKLENLNVKETRETIISKTQNSEKLDNANDVKTNKKPQLKIPDGALLWFGVEGNNMKLGKPRGEDKHEYEVYIQHDPSEGFDVKLFKNEGEKRF